VFPFQRLTSAFRARRVLRDLSRLADALDRQNVYLARLADRFAPVDPPTDRAEVKSDTGVSHLDVIDAGLVQDYVARTVRDTGHYPDDEEILIYLADEKTTDLHRRLAARDQELSRLAEDRA
jgi:hypothetical protein